MTISASNLTVERAKLLVRLKEIEAALALLKNPGKAVEIYTHRNLRNTYLGDVSVYTDESLTVREATSSHSGWITAEDAAYLRSEFADAIEEQGISILD